MPVVVINGLYQFANFFKQIDKKKKDIDKLITAQKNSKENEKNIKKEILRIKLQIKSLQEKKRIYIYIIYL